MMDESQLIKRISELPDDDLLRIIYADSSQYRFETVVYAKAEIKKRGVLFDESDINRAISESRARSTSEFAPRTLAFLTSRTTTFTIGFIGGLFLCVLANYQSVEYPTMDDGFGDAGWPFRFYTFGGFVGTTYVHWPLLLADILIGLVISIGIGLIFSWLIRFLKSSSAK